MENFMISLEDIGKHIDGEKIQKMVYCVGVQ
jgi:hypothetical protein